MNMMDFKNSIMFEHEEVKTDHCRNLLSIVGKFVAKNGWAENELFCSEQRKCCFR